MAHVEKSEHSNIIYVVVGFILLSALALNLYAQYKQNKLNKTKT
jgi:hypothetical protein